MPNIVIVTGSPTEGSRLNGIVEFASKAIAGAGWDVTELRVTDLPAEDVMFARWDSPAIIEANRIIAEADAVVIASPVYKASYTGVLKAFLDLLPQKGLEGKAVLPLFIGGTIAHLLAIDYAMKPVLSALYAKHISTGVFAVDSQIARTDNGGFILSEELTDRLAGVIETFLQTASLFIQQKNA
ncbi:NADPH-dependent FMN reductase [Paenibacillus sp. GCM10027626]|uniref:NADPH-dependent FMN reductase n=1 Tax=Paenibacillus sp. GCM10027626 TaxID=3273411 RepID=UPI00363BC54B